MGGDAMHVRSKVKRAVCCSALLLAIAWSTAPPILAQKAPATSAAPATEPQGTAPDSGTALPRRFVVRFVTEGDFPPFNFYDEEGVLTGFNVDLARALCLELAAACDIKVRPWDELPIALRNGEADAVIAGHAITHKSLADMEFTDRYFHMAARFATRRDAKLEITPEALEGKRIGVARGTAHEAYLRQFFRESAIQAFETHDLARDALVQGKIDVLFDDGVSLSFWLNGTLSKQCCELAGGPFLEPRYFGDGMAIGVPRQDKQIRMLLNTALKRVRDSGRLDELMQRYFPYRIF